MTNPVFGFERPEDSPGFLLWQTTIIWQRLIKKSLDAHGISHAQFVILAISLWFEGKKIELTQSLIIQQSKLDKMTVSKSLKILAGKNLVQRFAHKQDTRIKTIRLTEKGREMASKLVPIVEKTDEKFFGAVKKSNRKILIKILQQLTLNTVS